MDKEKQIILAQNIKKLKENYDEHYRLLKALVYAIWKEEEKMKLTEDNLEKITKAYRQAVRSEEKYFKVKLNEKEVEFATDYAKYLLEYLNTAR